MIYETRDSVLVGKSSQKDIIDACQYVRDSMPDLLRPIAGSFCTEFRRDTKCTPLSFPASPAPKN